MSKLLVFGHQNPDTDTIASAIALTYLINELSLEAEAVAFGDPNVETSYALDYFRIDAPRVVDTVADETDEVILVDHNEMQQSAPDISKVTVKGVVDHHRIANFQTADPLYYRAEPLGSTATILYKLFNEYEVTIPSNIAGIMLSAIISDTLLLKSPTTTPQDVEIAEELAEIAGVSLDEYGLNMLKAGTDVSTKTAEEIFNDDAKTFPMGAETVRIGQVNVVDSNDILVRKDEILEVMREEAEKNEFDLTLLMITDIIENNSIVIVDGPSYRQVEIAFSKPIQFNTIELDGVVSRKKQVVPPLTNTFNKHQK